MKKENFIDNNSNNLINKKLSDENKTLNNSKMIIKQKENEKKNSNQKQQKINEIKNNLNNINIDITFSVDKIYQIISFHKKLNSKIIFLTLILLFLTLLILNFLIIFLFAFIRPTLLTNKFSCFNLITKKYSKCLLKNKCFCPEKNCVYFCYENDYLICNDYFESENLKESQKNIQIYSTKFKSFIKYEIKKNEKISLFQKIGKNYCKIDFYLFLFLIHFSIGIFFGFYFFGILCDLYGKKINIIIMLIGTILMNLILIICNFFEFNKNLISFTIIYCFIFLFFGMFCFPLESLIYLYFLEINPIKKFFKSINGLLYEKYFISLLFFYIFNDYVKNFQYMFFIIEGYLIFFLIIFIFFFVECPRFFSERNDFKNKKKCIKKFVKNENEINFILNEENKNIRKNSEKIFQEKNKNLFIKKNINLNYLKNIINKNYINKKLYLINLFFFSLNFCFYSIFFTFIFKFFDPNNFLITKSTKNEIILIMLFLFPLLQIPSYFLFKLNLDKYLIFFVLLLSIITINYDIDEINFDSDRIFLYEKYLIKPLKKNFYLGFGFFFIIFIISIFEILILLQANTLFRTYFYFNIKKYSNLSIILSFFFVNFVELTMIVFAIVCFVLSLLLLVMRITWKFDLFKEEINM